MLSRLKLIASLALVLLPASASASLVYVVTDDQQFGTIDLGTGAFQRIGPNTPEASSGLVPGPNGSLLSLTLSGKLESINPATGMTSVIGATGLADCTVANGMCAPNSANAFAAVNGKLYATDLANNLYTVDPVTGAAHLIGPTGVPAVPPGFPNLPEEGPISFFDEGLYGVGGKLYTTFNATMIDPASGTFTVVVPPFLYQIDPATGMTIRVAPTLPALKTTVDVNGTFYAFKANTRELLTLDLTNGNTQFVTKVADAAGLISGAAPVAAVPEPASFALAGIGIAAILGWRRRTGSLIDANPVIGESKVARKRHLTHVTRQAVFAAGAVTRG